MNISEINISVKRVKLHRGKPNLWPAHAKAEDCYFAERTDDDITGSDLVGQLAERGVSQILKLFIRFLPVNQKIVFSFLLI